jgi:tape measure domain-containing protein
MTGAAGAEVGSGHVSIFPVMTGFRSMVSKEIQASGKEGGSIFSRAFQGVGSKAGSSLGKDMKSAFNGSAGDLASPALKKMQSEVASAARAMSAARLKQQDAAGKVRVAEAQLAAAIAKNGAESVQAVAASERLASAKRREQSTSEALTAAEGRLKDAKKAVSDVKQATIEAPKTGVFTNAIQRIRSSVQGLNRENVDAVSSKLSGFGVKWGVVAGVAGAATQRIMGLFSGMISGAMDASDSTQKFKNTLNFAGIDTETIGKLVDQTQVYADRTVYNLGDIRSATAQLASNGVKDYANLVEAAGNLNAVAGGNADTFKSVTMVLTQTAGAGKLTTENWNQLRDAIPGASGKIQDALKKNKAFTGNFSDALEKGQVSADEFNQALMDLGMTDIAKKAAADSSTFEGAMGNWEAAVEKFGSTFLDTMKPQLTGAINFASDKLGNFTNWFKTTWDSVSGLIAEKDFKGAFKKAFNVDDSTMRRLEESFSGIHEGLNTIGDALSPLKSKVTGAGSSFPTLNRGLNGFAQALDTVQPVLPAIAKLLDLFGELPTGVQSAVLGFALFGRQASMVLSPIGMVVKASAGLVKGIGSVGSAIGGLVSGRLSKSSSITSIAESLEDAGSNASSAAPKISSAAKSVETLDTKAAGAVKKTGGLSSALGGFNLAGAAFGVAALGVTAYTATMSDQMQKTQDMADSFSSAMKDGADAVGIFWEQMQSGQSGGLGLVDKLSSLGKDSNLAALVKDTGTSWSTVKDAIAGTGDAMSQLDKAAGSGITFNGTYKAKMQSLRDVVNELKGSYQDTIKEMVAYSQTQEAINNGTSSVQSAFSELSTTLKANGDNLANNGQLTAASQQAVSSATDALWQNVQAQLEYGKTSGDMTTAIQGAKNSVQQMRDSLISTLEQQGMSSQAAAQYADSLGLIPANVGTTFTENSSLTKGQVEAYLNTLGLTPAQKSTVMNALTSQANGDISNLHLNMDNLPEQVKSLLTADNTDAQQKTGDATTSLRHFNGSKANASLNADNSDVKNKASEARGSIKSVPEEHKTNFFAEQAGSGWTNIKNFFGSFGSTMKSYWGLSHGGEVHRANGGIVQRLASGGPSGFVSGPGTSTSDSIMTWLSDGEYVIRAAAARKIGLQNLDRANRTGRLENEKIIQSQPVQNTYYNTFQIPETNTKLLANEFAREIAKQSSGGAR